MYCLLAIQCLSRSRSRNQLSGQMYAMKVVFSCDCTSSKCDRAKIHLPVLDTSRPDNLVRTIHASFGTLRLDSHSARPPLGSQDSRLNTHRQEIPKTSFDPQIWCKVVAKLVSCSLSFGFPFQITRDESHTPSVNCTNCTQSAHISCNQPRTLSD